MKLLLIEPSNRVASVIDRLPVPPLSLGVIAALTPPEWEVRIVQEPYDTVDLESEIDLVGITAGTTNVRRGYQLADEFRRHGRPVIMGGIHPSVLPSEALAHCDSVCIGEAETIWKGILEDCLAGKLRPTYRQDVPTDLDSYVSPRRELLPARTPFLLDIGTIETSRGCPYACEFCSASTVYGRKVRERSMDGLCAEIEAMRTRSLFFVDNNIFTNPHRTKNLFREIAPLKRRWAAQASLSFAADRELVELAARSGCFGLFIGLESVAAEGHNTYRKNAGNLEEMKERLRVLREHGIGVHASVIFGHDFETRDTIRRSLDTLLSLDIVTATFGILTPLPGTVIAARLEAEGRVFSKNWDCYDLNHLVFTPRSISCGDFLSDMRAMRKSFFSARATIRRVLKSGSPLLLGVGYNMAVRAHHRIGKAPFLAETTDPSAPVVRVSFPTPPPE
jgi:radical SAM superfamily enzyme YgiQ (UPF0313 family)